MKSNLLMLFFLIIFKILIYLFGLVRFQLWHTGSRVSRLSSGRSSSFLF